MIRRIILTAVTTLALAAPALAQSAAPAAPTKHAITKPAKPTVHHVAHKAPAKPTTVKKTAA
jgi:hypothetical protein